MRPESRKRLGPSTPAFERLKKIVKHLAEARLKCGCIQCVGSTYGDHSPNHLELCDGAIEDIANGVRK